MTLYNLELPQVISKIRESKAQTVCLQLPEGMKPYAQEIEEYNVEYNILFNKILVNERIILDRGYELTLTLPEDARTIESNVDYELNKNLIKLKAKEIKLNYITNSYIEEGNKNYFLKDFKVPLKTNNLNINLILPEKSILDKPISQDGSIYPKPDKITTDGQRILITWTRQNLEKDQGIALFVIYKEPEQSYYAYIFLAALILIFSYLLLRKPKEIVKTVTKDITELQLKEDEKIIARILKQKEGECYQSTLAVITNFSKAKLSRILEEMEQRNIVKRLEKGKKKLVILKAKIE